jgi:hypothetical protein
MALLKMAPLDTRATRRAADSIERKAVLVLKQHAIVAVDDKDLLAMHSLTHLAVGARRTREIGGGLRRPSRWRSGRDSPSSTI